MWTSRQPFAVSQGTPSGERLCATSSSDGRCGLGTDRQVEAQNVCSVAYLLVPPRLCLSDSVAWLDVCWLESLEQMVISCLLG